MQHNDFKKNIHLKNFLQHNGDFFTKWDTTIKHEYLYFGATLYDICKKITLKSIKSPATADFPLFNRNKVIRGKKLDYNIYQLDSYFDTQNSFGAMIRTFYTCRVKIKYNPKFNDWRERLIHYNFLK